MIYIYIYIYGPALCVPSPPPPPMVSPPTPPMICFKSANSHRDQPRQGRHPRNWRRFWSRKASILVTVVTFGPYAVVALQKYQQSQGSAWSSSRSSELSSLLTPHVSTDYKCIIFPPSELSSLLAPYVFVALQMYRQINNHRYKPSIEP